MLNPHESRYVAHQSDRTIAVQDTSTQKIVLRLPRRVSEFCSLSWSPDGRTIASGHADGTVSLWDVATSREHLRLNAHSSQVVQLGWSSDSRYIVSTSSDGAMRLWDTTKDHQQLPLHSGHKGVFESMLWPPDWTDFAGGEMIKIVENAYSPPVQRVDNMFEHPETLEAVRDAEGVVALRETSSGETVLRFPKRISDVCSLSWSPNWQTIASGHENGTISLWDVGTGKERLRLSGHRGRVIRIAWSADSYYLASTSSDGTICVWNAWTGNQQELHPRHVDTIQLLSRSPDGYPTTEMVVDLNFDGELPADILAEFPIAKLEEPGRSSHPPRSADQYSHYQGTASSQSPSLNETSAWTLPLVILGMFAFAAIGIVATFNIPRGESTTNINNTPTPYCVVRASNNVAVNLYSEPSEESVVIGRLSKNERLDYRSSQAESDGMWRSVRSSYLGAGWVKASESSLVGKCTIYISSGDSPTQASDEVPLSGRQP